MIDEISQLKLILAVARTGSFTRAAQEMNVSQPVLSRSIAAFEARHSMRVFDRGRTGAVPTAIGLSVIRDAARLVRTQRDFRANIELYRCGEAGEVAVGLGALLASLFLPELSKTFVRERPKLRLMTVINSSSRLYSQLMDDTLEIIFANNSLLKNMEDVVVSPIGALDLAPVVRFGHPLAGRNGVTLDDLAAFPVAGGWEWRLSERKPEAGGFTCDNFHILRETVLETDCVWLSSLMFLKPDIEQERLVPLKVTDFHYTQTEIGVAHRYGREISPAATGVIDLIKALVSASKNSSLEVP
jgi:DNA-binding transcriptional LysR family regulator